MFWTESNQYIITHNTRPSPESMPCEDCHSRKQSGSFSSLVSADGVLGEGNVKEVVQLPDRRLVDEGIVVLDMPYMKVDDTGRVTENVGDILYTSKLDSSMTILKNSTARAVTGEFKPIKSAELIGVAANFGLALQQDLPSVDSFMYATLKGKAAVRKNLALAIDGGGVNELTFTSYRVEVGLIPGAGVDAAKDLLNRNSLGSLSSDVFVIDISNKSKGRVENVGDRPLLVMMPYRGLP